MPNPKKEKVVADLINALRNSSSALLTDYRGLTVAQITDLRRKLREANAEYHVVKNTLFMRALRDVGYDIGQLEGPTAVAFTHNDPVGPAKVLIDFMRENKAPTPKGGIVEGRVISAEQVEALSTIPPREVLLAQAVAGIQAPITGLVSCLQGVISNFVLTLQAVADKKAQSAPA
ncbi:MAG: 50S ribosomal protein L10 [Armatimonadota bacterium]